MPTKQIIYYTDSQLDEKYAKPVREQLKTIGLPIISSSLEPLDFGHNIHLDMERGYYTMFCQILACLDTSKADVIYFCEHDVLYDPSHFEFIPPDKDKFYYDINWWKVRSDGLAVHWDAAQVSGLVCYREAALKWYEERIASYDEKNFDRKFEPTLDGEYRTWWGREPHIDIRHNRNLTYNKWKMDHFRDKTTAVNFVSTTIDSIPGWENLSDMIK
jgi:hypothetical protein